MKRNWTTLGFKLGQAIRRRKAAKRHSLVRRSQKRPTPNYRKGRADLVAPTTLSVFDAPNETLEFLNALRSAISQRNVDVFLDLRRVERFSSDALLVMRAMMDGRTKWGAIGGNLPTNAMVASKVKSSGFFNGFVKPPSSLPPPRGMLKRKTDRLVVNTTASEMVAFAAAHATMSRAEEVACYQTLMELMSNTHHHANQQSFSESPGKEHSRRQKRRDNEARSPWSAMVYCEEGVANFTIADLGVGILRSAKARGFVQRIGLTLGAYGHVQLLKDVFSGVVGSSTGEPGRGQGLPGLRSTARTTLPTVQVLTSHVIGDVNALGFKELPITFRGTIYRWSVGARKANHGDN